MIYASIGGPWSAFILFISNLNLKHIVLYLNINSNVCILKTKRLIVDIYLREKVHLMYLYIFNLSNEYNPLFFVKWKNSIKNYA